MELAFGLKRWMGLKGYHMIRYLGTNDDLWQGKHEACSHLDFTIDCLKRFCTALRTAQHPVSQHACVIYPMFLRVILMSTRVGGIEKLVYQCKT